MEIVYFGHSSFRIKGKNAAIITDPHDEKAGKFPKDAEAGIVTVSHAHEDHNQTKKISGNPFIISGPGEYEIGGTSVVGIHTFHDEKEGSERGANTVYVIEVEGMRVAHLGDLGHKLTENQMEEIGSVDILMIPIGGVYTIDAKTASEVVKQLDPSIVIPMHYKQEGQDAAMFGQLGTLEDFLKELGKTEITPIPKLVMSTDKLPTELQVVVLEKK